MRDERKSERKTTMAITIQNIYTVLDLDAEVYGPPFYAINDTVAIKMYQQMVAKLDSAYKFNFKLIHLGWFDPQSGELVSEGIKPLDVNVKIKECKDLTEVAKDV